MRGFFYLCFLSLGVMTALGQVSKSFLTRRVPLFSSTDLKLLRAYELHNATRFLLLML